MAISWEDIKESPWFWPAVVGGGGILLWTQRKRLGLGEPIIMGPDYGATPQQAKFARAAKRCRGRRLGAFRACMSQALGGTGLGGVSKKRRKRKTRKKSRKARRRSSGMSGVTAQRRKFKSAAKKCKGNRNFRGCMSRALKK